MQPSSSGEVLSPTKTDAPTSIFAESERPEIHVMHTASSVINERVPAYLRDEDDLWTALSLRARIIAIAKDRVPEGAITRIEDLAKPEWKGRVCTRKGSHVYNRALLASLIAHLGEEKAEAWVEGLVSNLARRPHVNDPAQAKAMFAG